MFWNRWLKEYLPSLIQRKKWTKNCRNFKKGDLVLLSCDNAPRSHWPMGRILETYPSNDGIVRKVKVKTPNSELIRPSGKLCLLETAT